MPSTLQFAPQYVYRVKCLIQGPRNAGKSTLLHTYVHDKPTLFQPKRDTLDVSFKKQMVQLDNCHYECKMHLWDLDEDLYYIKHHHEFLVQKLFYNTNVFILLYYNEKSFLQCKNTFFKEIHEYQNSLSGISEKGLVYIVLNQGHPNCSKQFVLQQRDQQNEINVGVNKNDKKTNKALRRTMTDIRTEKNIEKMGVDLVQKHIIVNVNDATKVREELFKIVAEDTIKIFRNLPNIQKCVSRDRNQLPIFRYHSDAFDKKANRCF